MTVTILHALARPFQLANGNPSIIADANGAAVADCYGDEPLAAKLVEVLNGKTLPAEELGKLDAILDGAEGFISGFIGDETQEQPVDDLVDAIQAARTRLDNALSIGSEPEAPKK